MPLPKEPVTEPVLFSFADAKQLISIIDLGTKLHLVICDLCGSMLNLGIRAAGHPIIQHRDSASCKKKAHNLHKQVAKEKLLVSSQDRLCF
jgi:hypothetical protein